MHSGEPDPIFLAPRRPRKGPEKLVRKWVVSGQATASRRSVAEPGWGVAVRLSGWVGQAAGCRVTL